jgi:hypothetical protein
MKVNEVCLFIYLFIYLSIYLFVYLFLIIFKSLVAVVLLWRVTRKLKFVTNCKYYLLLV